MTREAMQTVQNFEGDSLSTTPFPERVFPVKGGQSGGTQARGESARTAAILSLSLLTVLAGAAIAPALEVIQAAFSGEAKSSLQLIVSMPALFIALTSFVFPKLASRFTAKQLTASALLLYIVGGVAGGLCNSIAMILVFRALLGVATGIIMPMSTGLLSYYYGREKQDKLMGYSSAMNQMGGVVATLATGMLAAISWRASFLVYLMGLPSLILVILFVPNDCIGAKEKTEPEAKKEPLSATLRSYGLMVVSMFFLMLTFFIYPSSFAIETVSEGIIPSGFIAPIMAILDFVAFLGGLSFAHLQKTFGKTTRLIAPLLFILGYMLLALVGGWVGTIAGSIIIGFANGMGIPYLMAAGAKHAGKKAATTVLPLLSMALYAAQFVTPFVLAGAEVLVNTAFGEVTHLSYFTAIFTGICFFICSACLKGSHR